MRLIIGLLLALLYSLQLTAKDGYKITIKLTDRKDSMLYLAHYYGRPFPTIYKSDSARMDKNGVAVFTNSEKTTGGIYMILSHDLKSYFEFLLNNGDDLTATAAMDNLPKSVAFKGSPLNNDFKAYQEFLVNFSKEQQEYQSALAKATTKADSANIHKQITKAGEELKEYRRKYVASHGGNLLASIFNALELPEIPEGEHHTEDGKVDSNYGYRFYKAHYWDGFDFQDDRLIHTPILQSRLDEYFNRLVYNPDTAIENADMILSKARGSEHLFRYTLNWLSTNAQTSKIMGMDKLFVHLVGNYYMKGDASWLSDEDLAKYIDRAKKIAPNLIDNPAPELQAVDVELNPKSLYDYKAKYTLLIFYSPDCGHCIKEIPQIDSLYRAELKAKGLRVWAFNVDKEELKWREFIKKHKLDEWQHIWDPKNASKYWAKYDVQATPSIYLLDEEKIIKGKKLDVSTIAKALEIAELKKKK